MIAFCPVCGIIARTGERSCCGVGGSWFQKCAKIVGSEADHTWKEGIKACKTGTDTRGKTKQNNKK